MPIFATVLIVLRFATERVGAVLMRVGTPLVLSWVVFYLSFTGYLNQLQRFMHTPNDRAASLLLGWTAIGFMVFLFLHSSIAISITEMILKPEKKVRWLGFRIGRNVWRLYAAHLRVLLMVAVGSLAVVGFVAVGRRLGLLPHSAHALYMALAYLAIALFIAVLSVRIVFVMAPLCVAEKGSIVRRAWAVTSAAPVRTTIIIALLLVPGLILLIAGNYLMVATGVFPEIPQPVSLAIAAQTLKAILPIYLALFVLSYFVSVTLLSFGAVTVYRNLAASS